jgi:GxxExxY protein
MNRKDAKDAEWELSEAANRVSHEIIGAAISVHRELGPGFLESLYEEALCIELRARGLPFARQATIPLTYRGRPIGQLRLDLVVAELVVVELKAVDALAKIHEAQLLAYLKATGLKLGLFINFKVPVLREGLRRLVSTA